MRLFHSLRQVLPLLAATAIIAGSPSSAASQPWSDNFDSYAAGGLVGNGAWEAWDDISALDAVVTDTLSLSGTYSAKILPTTDVVRQFSGATSGQWTMSAWNYIPAGSTERQFFILLNQYQSNSNKNWSLCMEFNSSTGRVTDAAAPRGPSIDIVFDQWVNVTVEVDLDLDLQSIYYNGTFLIEKSWTEGTSGGGGLDIAALDLFSDGGSSIYWDDIALTQGITPVKRTSWGRIKTLFK